MGNGFLRYGVGYGALEEKDKVDYRGIVEREREGREMILRW